jgi:NADH:ubiquinone oxidoreductase subunit 4 (subunit M)
MLSSLIFIPLLGMIVVMMLPKDAKWLIRWWSVGISVVPMIISFYILFDYYANFSATAALQYVEGPFDWIPTVCRYRFSR